MNTIMKKLQGSSHKKYNEKTHDSYEEFKLVTTSGTEYQCIRKGNDEILSHNEYGLGNHGIYDFKKLIESRLRPNNNSMTFNYEKLNHMLDNIMEKEEQYLMTRMKQLGLLTDTNKDSFDPWKAIYYQLFYEELEGEHKDTILTHTI